MTVCACHGVEMRWNRDPRYRAGGFWKCRASDNAQKRARYATDRVFRITKQLDISARSRRRLLARREEPTHSSKLVAAALLAVKRSRS